MLISIPLLSLALSVVLSRPPRQRPGGDATEADESNWSRFSCSVWKNMCMCACMYVCVCVPCGKALYGEHLTEAYWVNWIPLSFVG